METRLKIFLVISLLGMLLLLFLSQHLEPRPLNIADITESYLGKNVKIQGQISEIRSYTNKTFHVITISDSTGNITATASTSQPENFKEKINQTQNYTITGKVSEYNSTLQISINKITVA